MIIIHFLKPLIKNNCIFIHYSLIENKNLETLLPPFSNHTFQFLPIFRKASAFGKRIIAKGIESHKLE